MIKAQSWVWNGKQYKTTDCLESHRKLQVELQWRISIIGVDYDH